MITINSVDKTLTKDNGTPLRFESYSITPGYEVTITLKDKQVISYHNQEPLPPRSYPDWEPLPPTSIKEELTKLVCWICFGQVLWFSVTSWEEAWSIPLVLVATVLIILKVYK